MKRAWTNVKHSVIHAWVVMLVKRTVWRNVIRVWGLVIRYAKSVVKPGVIRVAKLARADACPVASPVTKDVLSIIWTNKKYS